MSNHFLKEVLYIKWKHNETDDYANEDKNKDKPYHSEVQTD